MESRLSWMLFRRVNFSTTGNNQENMQANSPSTWGRMLKTKTLRTKESPAPATNAQIPGAKSATPEFSVLKFSAKIRSPVCAWELRRFLNILQNSVLPFHQCCCYIDVCRKQQYDDSPRARCFCKTGRVGKLDHCNGRF